MFLAEIMYLIAGVTFFIAALLLAYKYVYVKSFQKSYKRKFPFKVFGLYPMNQIYGTSSADKKRLMTRCNILTVITDLCLIPVAIVAIVHLVELVTSVLEHIINKVD
jgi:hypothetical protein